MFCVNCGKPLASNTKFCGSCGHSIDESQQNENQGTVLETTAERLAPSKSFGLSKTRVIGIVVLALVVISGVSFAAWKMLISLDKDSISIAGQRVSIDVTELDLSHTNIKNLKPLQSLDNLTSLNLGYTQITDITPLQSLTNLTELYLNDTNVTDITPLQSLNKLSVLYLYIG